MAVTVVQSATGTSLPLSFPGTVTAGNTVIAVVDMIQSGTPVLASPTLGGSSVTGSYAIWNQGGSNAVIVASPAAASSGWVLPNCAAANGVDFTTKNISANVGVYLYEVSGLGSAPVIDKSNAASAATGTAISSGASGNTTTAPVFVIGAMASYAGTATGATGFTSVTTGAGNGWAGYQIDTSAGNSYTWAQTGGSSNGWTAGVAAVVASGAAAPTNQFFTMFR